MTGRVENTVELETSVVERLSEYLAPHGWVLHRIERGDEVAFVREPTSECTWHFGVNLAGREGVSLSGSVCVEHVVVAEEQRRLYVARRSR
ncbi:hypothetical protein K1W54_23865 [Micromonospora sp. CPCC 205371]|nr:hypothetical protein [Micromonospora sp. CPCC 205371]